MRSSHHALFSRASSMAANSVAVRVVWRAPKISPKFLPSKVDPTSTGDRREEDTVKGGGVAIIQTHTLQSTETPEESNKQKKRHRRESDNERGDEENDNHRSNHRCTLPCCVTCYINVDHFHFAFFVVTQSQSHPSQVGAFFSVV